MLITQFPLNLVGEVHWGKTIRLDRFGICTAKEQEVHNCVEPVEFRSLARELSLELGHRLRDYTGIEVTHYFPQD